MSYITGEFIRQLREKKQMTQRELATQKVNLAVGVPLTLYGKEKKAFKNYLLANDKAVFFYEGVRYVIHFGKVRVFA